MGNVKRRRCRVKPSDPEIGYGSPPRQHQFKAGQSGNPKGRPKGVRNFKTDVNTTLREPVKVAREGKTRSMSTQAAMLLRLREQALKGDPRSLDRLITLAQTYGDDVPNVSVELSAEDERVLEIYRRRVLSGASQEFNSTESKGDSTAQRLKRDKRTLE